MVKIMVRVMEELELGLRLRLGSEVRAGVRVLAIGNAFAVLMRNLTKISGTAGHFETVK